MQPQNPDPKFDFMLKDQPVHGHGYKWAHLHGRTKVTLSVIAGVILLIVATSLLSGRNKGSTQPIINVMARGQENLRITQEVQQQLHLQDPTTQALAATVYSSLSSDQSQMKAYLATNKTKVSKALLAADADKSTDSQLQSASQNNSLDAAYVTYLKDNLAKYQTDLQTAYKAAGPKGQIILKSASESVATILNSPALKSTSSSNFVCNSAGATACQ